VLKNPFLRAVGLAVLVSGAHVAQAQQELMLSQMPDVWHSNLAVNPAVVPSGKHIFIGLPGIGLGASHSGSLTYGDFFRTENGERLVDFAQVIPKLDAENTLNYQQRLETVSAGLRLGSTTVHLAHAIRLNSSTTYPRELVELLWEGNGQFVGEQIQIAPRTTSYDWHEISLGLSHNLGKITLGARAKYLAGISALVSDSDANSAQLFTDSDVYQLTLNTNYGFHSAGLISAIDTSGLGFNVVTGSFDRQFRTKNSGFALDLGVNAQLTERLSAQVSVLDLGGSIRWKTADYYRSQGSYTYEGATILGSDLINGADSLDFSTKLDTLNDLFQFKKTAGDAFTTKLPLRFYASVRYELTKKWAFGASLYHQNPEGNSLTAGGVSVHWRPIKLVTVGAMYSVNNQSSSNLGLSLVLKPGPVQIYAASDNLVSAFTPKSTSQVNFRLGLALQL
jgi:hypothetical protein